MNWVSLQTIQSRDLLRWRQSIWLMMKKQLRASAFPYMQFILQFFHLQATHMEAWSSDQQTWARAQREWAQRDGTNSGRHEVFWLNPLHRVLQKLSRTPEGGWTGTITSWSQETFKWKENEQGERSVKTRKCKNSTAARLLFNSHQFDLLVNKAVRVSVVNVLEKPTVY